MKNWAREFLGLRTSVLPLSCLWCVAAVLLLSFSASALAQEASPAAEGSSEGTTPVQGNPAGADAWRKAAQNPFASLISVPIQNNDNTGITRTLTDRCGRRSP
jgi:hypothetical protein